MATNSPVMNLTIPNQRSVKTGRIILFILALVAVMIATRPAMADTLCMKISKAYHNVTVVSETKETIAVRLGDNRVMEIQRQNIVIHLKRGMKIYVYRRDFKDFTAYFRGSDESGYVFASQPDGSGEFTVKESDIFLISLMTPEEFNAKYKENPPPADMPDIYPLISALGFIQGVFLAFMLLRKKTGNRRANRILGLFIIAGSYCIGWGFFYTYFYKYLFSSPLVIFNVFDFSVRFTAGPLLYFYVLALIRPGFRLSPKHGLHLLPACLYGTYEFLRYIMMNQDQIRLFYNFWSTFYVLHSIEIIVAIAFYIQISIYVIVSVRFLARHRRRIQNIFSVSDTINLSWLSYILRFMAAICAFMIIGLILNMVMLVVDIDRYSPFCDSFLNIFVIILVAVIGIMFFAIGYRGLLQPEIFAGIPDDLIEEPEGPDQKMSLSPEKAREIMDRVIKVMDEDRPYLDPGLTLPMLADMAGVSRNLLSQAINEHTGQNFYEFVNFYRVETAKEYLKDPEKREMNVLHIAFDAGFNTKATFNSVFKKSTGLTPSEYRKSSGIEEGVAPAEPAGTLSLQ
ncbi:MAG TPA: helix-turn-helix domain-containing protein [Spirochaetota bacterium]|nr:helix-turn-helix domain-containing protein [Spirochaetota bacterium]HSA14882.1 helix-turn-helix domain-containing protein [Spirochaetota bacterium]